MNFPSESAGDWKIALEALHQRGLRKIGLLVADGITGLDTALAVVFSGTPLQWCVTHIKRGVLRRVRNSDKSELDDDLRQVFRSDLPDDTAYQGWIRWVNMCRKWNRRYPGIGKLANEKRNQNGFTYMHF